MKTKEVRDRENDNHDSTRVDFGILRLGLSF